MTSFKKAVFLLIFFLFPLLGGCNTPPPLLPTTTPIESISYKNSVDNERCCLLVLLPGRKSRAGDFEAEGFIVLALFPHPFSRDGINHLNNTGSPPLNDK